MARRFPVLPRHHLPNTSIQRPRNSSNVCSRVFDKFNLQSPLAPSPEISRYDWEFQPSSHLVILVTSPILRLSRDPI